MIRKYYSILPSEGGKGSELRGKIKNAILVDEGDVVDNVLSIISEQAKQDSIELLRWMTDNVLRAEDGERWKILDSDCNLIVNESQLYDYFTEQRNKQG